MTNIKLQANFRDSYEIIRTKLKKMQIYDYEQDKSFS